MAVIDTILEYSVAQVTGGVIKGVKIAGLISRNGRKYPTETMRKAISLYEDAPVYMLHGTRIDKMHDSRKFHEHFGSLKSVHLRPDGLWGDLHVKQSHPLATFVLGSDGREFGLSHNIRAEMTDDRKTVTEILAVNSVDLVNEPATTKNLFEEEEMDLAELVAANEAQAKQIKALTEGQGKILALLESYEPPVAAPPEPPKPPKKKRISVLEESTGDLEDPNAPTPIGNSHQAFMDKLRGFSTIDKKGAVA